MVIKDNFTPHIYVTEDSLRDFLEIWDTPSNLSTILQILEDNHTCKIYLSTEHLMHISTISTDYRLFLQISNRIPVISRTLFEVYVENTRLPIMYPYIQKYSELQRAVIINKIL